MASLSDFADFVKSTAPAWASSQDAFVNEIQQNSYPLARFLKGREMSDVFQNGERIKDGIILDQPGTFQMISPETESTWTNAQTLTTWEIPWRFAQAHMAWTAQEVELNEGSSAAVWKRVKKIKQTGLANDIVHGLNSKLFARPLASKMESFTADPGEPQSIPALVNEYDNGLFGHTISTDGSAATPTVSDKYTSTVQGINPATKTKWAPVRKTYGSLTPGGATNLLAAFDDIFLDLQFRQPGTMNEYFENESMFRQVIYTSKNGIVSYKRLLRSENDVQVVPGRQDPAYQNPTYSGIPLERAPQLETEALYVNDTGSTLYTELSISDPDNLAGARYYWINANFMKMAFHSNYYFKYLDVFSPEKNRTKYILPIQIWFNLYVTSRRHQGIVAPSAVIS
jgi:hypothetical protein